MAQTNDLHKSVQYFVEDQISRAVNEQVDTDTAYERENLNVRAEYCWRGGTQLVRLREYYIHS